MELIRQILSVAVVFALLGASLWWLRAKNLARTGGGKRGERRLEALEKLPLTPHHALHLVRAADRGLLVAVHASGCSVLDSRPWHEWEEHARAAGAPEGVCGAAR